MQAHFLDAGLEGQISAHDVLSTTLDALRAARRSARAAATSWRAARELSRHPGAERQRERAREPAGLAGLVAALADAF